MNERRWFNPHQPQTLQIAVLLLYLNGAFLVLNIFGGGLGGIGTVIWLGLIAGHAYGGWGIANEQKRGYQVGVAMAIAPFALRVWFFGVDALLGGDLISLLFEIALVALLLHPQSREYQQVWFK